MPATAPALMSAAAKAWATRRARALAAPPAPFVPLSQRRQVRYDGHRWEVKADRGAYLYVERQRGHYGQWIAAACTTPVLNARRAA